MIKYLFLYIYWVIVRIFAKYDVTQEKDKQNTSSATRNVLKFEYLNGFVFASQNGKI
jgi:hypothetical protein